ncbi:MAG: cupin domain-containing protein [Eubacteriales bacterium]|nr:cupin domain-containing protein [Clostridiales bacterium]MDD6722219.1 cupin domain-containing protein [Clostridiales bacterium]MDY5693924.1 cupin domain-containing protein [Eubacteriales bacterium]
MSIIPCGEIGAEIHPDTDQFIRVEEGEALVRMGDCREKLDFQCRLSAGEAIFVPSGTWHNVLNAGKCPLKLSSVYAPPHHPAGSIHRTKADE